MINCTFENGNKADPGLRHVTVVCIAVNDQNQILLTRRAAELTRGNYYTIPGGFLDRNETAAQAILRELEEETGYTGKVEYLFRINDNPDRSKEDRQNVDFIYVVRVLEGEKKLNEEVTEITWFNKENLPSEEVFAFDHRESILKYFEYLEKPFPLPLMGKIL